MTTEQFSEALKKIRKRLKLKQEDAARICEVSTRAFAGWEGQEAPKLKQTTMEGVLARLKKIMP